MLSPITGSSPQRKRHGNDGCASQGTFEANGIVSGLPRKRQKTNIMESFKSFSLKQPDEIPNRAQHPQRQQQSFDTNKSSFHEDDDINSEDSDAQDTPMLSDREEAERKVMYELVYGPSRSGGRHPVDVKVEEWIQREIWRRKQLATAIDQQQQHTTQDDMNLDHMAIYQDTAGNQSYQALDGGASSSSRPRSNSLPNVSSTMEVDGDAVMDTS